MFRSATVAVSLLLPLLVVVSTALKCEDLDLLCSGSHPTEVSFTLNQSAIPSFDGSAYIWATSGTKITSQTESIHCQEYSNYLLITSNGIPNHKVGKFPFRQGTTGRGHGDNPNTIQPQSYQWKIPKTPVRRTQAPTQNIMQNHKLLQMGPIGFALNGVPIFNPFNNEGEDAVNPTSTGYEVMDLCFGHPQKVGAYHYHHQAPKSGCLFTDTAGQHSPKIGYAFDGVPVYGPLSDNGVKPTDLDLCNGRTHPTLGYMYHITLTTAPYMIGCYMYQTTDAVNHGTISTSGATKVGDASTSCAAAIGQKATTSTTSTAKPASTSTAASSPPARTTTRTDGGSVTIGGGCPSGATHPGPQCPTACSSNAQCSGTTSQCCPLTGCTSSACIKPCPVHQCPATCAVGKDTHGCPTCSCTSGQGPGGSSPLPPMSPTRPGRTGRASTGTRAHTGTRQTHTPASTSPQAISHSSAAHHSSPNGSHHPPTGGTRHPPSPSGSPPTGSGSGRPHRSSPHPQPTVTSNKALTGITAGNQGTSDGGVPVTTQVAKSSVRKELVIGAIVAGVALAVVSVAAILLVMRKKGYLRAQHQEQVAATYRELQAGD